MKTLIPALLVLLVVFPAFAEEPEPTIGPKAAYQAMQEEMAALSKAGRRTEARAIGLNRPREFFAEWEASGRTAEGEELYYLGKLHQVARNHEQVMVIFRTCAGDGSLPVSLRTGARVDFGRAAFDRVMSDELTGDAAMKAAAEVGAYANVAEGSSGQRASMLLSAARCFGHLGEMDRSIDFYMRSAEIAPNTSYSVSRSVIPALMEGVTDLDAYDGLRERGEKLAARLLEIARKYVVDLRAKGGEREEQQATRFESSIKSMETMTRPLHMLGKPAPGWTALNTWGNTQALADRRGEVVIIDFWATWCGWCIKSFPAIREMLADYAGKDLALVGVTAPANSVLEFNYNLDDDMKHKAAAAGPLKVERFPRDGTDEEKAAFRARELEILTTFIKNHEMTWDVVMIDPTEPGEKYALTGWPHAVVCDRAGRVRYFKRGALLRDRPEAVAKFRKVLDALLAEPMFTHILVHDLDYYADGPQQGRPPDGKMLAGTKCVVLQDAGSYVRVRTENGVEGFVDAKCVKPVK